MDKRQLLIDEFTKGKVSRRDFNAGLIGLGLSVTAASAFVESTIAKAQESGPKRGGVMRLAMADGGASDTLDPARMTTGADRARAFTIFSRMIDFMPDEGLVGNLATSWEANADATQWVFELREGVEFHDGKSLTSADVVHSINRHLEPDSGSPAKGYLGDIEDVVADGGRHVVFNMKAPFPDLPFLLTDKNMLVHSEDMNREDFEAGLAIGTGPWMLKEFEPGISSTVERNPNYHRSDLPYIDEIEVFTIPDGNSRTTALLAGDTDIIHKVENQLIEAVENSDVANVLSYAAARHAVYPMLADSPPFSDNNLRLAVKHAIDRERFLELAFGNHGTVGRDHPFPVFDPFFAEDVEALPRDPDKVAYYLRQAGMEGTTLEIIASESLPGGANASVVLAALMGEAGLNVQVKRVPSDGYWDAVWMKAPWCGSEWHGRPTMDLMLSLVYGCGVPWNESRWCHERFEELVVAARREPDSNLRKEMYREIQLIMRDEGATLTPVFINFVDGYAKKVQNLKGHPYGPMGEGYWEEVWLDESVS